MVSDRSSSHGASKPMMSEDQAVQRMEHSTLAIANYYANDLTMQIRLKMAQKYSLYAQTG